MPKKNASTLRNRLLSISLFLLLVAACGQKGALISPSEVAEKRAEAEKIEQQARQQQLPANKKENKNND
ncbi:hypothetical protein FLL45_17680 [Aliikangiella marina]|uniref:Lipoprotein n=1 Tax=Aliikangiella marina TaxID=1712262 RepID=A0A545T496_9GAMM|nr:lipoprotein [Aliikangiella marina]TQV72000.1 hypothetical protein FLL45_17400 [Aliikangiella marina]TQV72053.1 hypothetical protein FLL45_17680 [Aliikangiella marina]